MSDAENDVVDQDVGEMARGESAEESKPEDQVDADQSMESTGSSVDSPTKSPGRSGSPKKTPQKRRTDQNGKEEETKDEDDDDEESSDEELVGLLDGPVKLMTGKRERKKTQRLTFDTKKEAAEIKFEVEDGQGTRLGEIPNIEFYISRTNSENFRAFYRFLFGRPGKAHEIKRNIRKFSGFNFEKESPEFTKKESTLVRYTMEGLREICMWLDLDKSGNKEKILERILAFCLKPEPSGRPHPQKKKRSNVVKKKAKKRKREASGGGDAKKTTKTKKAKTSPQDVEEEDQDEEDGDMEEEEAGELEDDEEEEMEEPKKKKAKLDQPSPQKKVEKKKPEKKKDASKSPKKTPSKKSPVKKSTPKKATAQKKASIQITPKSKPKSTSKSTPKSTPKSAPKSTPKSAPKSTPKSKAKKMTIEDSDDSSDDEPLIRKAEPSEAQIEQTVRAFLDKANLELVTMKMVCKKVYETYPDFNLAHKKDFIKATVRSIIS
ncbi:protein DEK-like [Acanthaster planci]|uniref:Protein DEK-like n=1 Tax=Acanthaster planci TaxID=133434 RepID=A0A8B7YM75_ACAPL|nr:protein DEK-like [Acanthaster planci]